MAYFHGSFRLDGLFPWELSFRWHLDIHFHRSFCPIFQPKVAPQANGPKVISYVRQNAKFEKGKSCINFEDFWIVFWSPTECFQSRAPGKIIFQGLSSGEMDRLVQSFQCFRLRWPLYTHFHGSFRPRWPLDIHFHWSFRLEAIFWDFHHNYIA